MTEASSPRRRIGIFGGTFSPPHVAHVRAALAFLSQVPLDELIVIPDAVPPHKQLDPGDDPALRLRMARAAFEGLDPRITVSDYEIRKAGVSYTVDTLAHFSGEGELYFLCGTDMFLSLDLWRQPERIFSLAVMTCAMREDSPADYAAVRRKAEEYRQRYGARTLLLTGAPLTLSSTAVRQKIRGGEDVSGLVPPAVLRIIEENRLYRNRE